MLPRLRGPYLGAAAYLTSISRFPLPAPLHDNRTAVSFVIGLFAPTSPLRWPINLLYIPAPVRLTVRCNCFLGIGFFIPNAYEIYLLCANPFSVLFLILTPPTRRPAQVAISSDPPPSTPNPIAGPISRLEI
jgi:hypothetical protein